MSFSQVFGGESNIKLFPFTAHTNDKISLQRGAKIFMNYCSGCHSLQFMRYNRMAKDIGITNDYGEVLVDVLEKNFIFTGVKIHQHIKSAMTEQESKRWFGVSAPDLTLVARVRGVRWLYTYLRTFYRDSKRPWGSNNLVYPDVAMPNILLTLQGDQIPIYREETVKGKKIQIFDHFDQRNNGRMTPQQYDQAVTDLVNFLAYVSAPMKAEQHSIGTWVLIFLIVFAIICYFLKREYWKNIH